MNKKVFGFLRFLLFISFERAKQYLSGKQHGKDERNQEAVKLVFNDIASYLVQYYIARD